MAFSTSNSTQQSEINVTPLIDVLLVLLVIGYHGFCFKLLRDFAAQRNTRSGNWYRGFNELLTPLLIVIVILAVVKPF